MYQPLLALWVLGPLLLSLADACARKAAVYVEPTVPSTIPVTDPNLMSSTAIFHHKLECTPLEVRKQACLQGGRCFVIEIQGRRSLNCEYFSSEDDSLIKSGNKNAEVEDSQYWQLCGEEYKGYCYHGGVCRYYRFQNVTMWRCECNVQNSGRRCELIVRPPFRSTPRVTVAHVAAGVGVAVFVTIVLLIAVIAYIQYKRKRHRREIRLDNPENEIGQPFTRRASVIGSDSRRGVPNSNGHADEKPMLEKPILNNDAETTTTV